MSLNKTIVFSVFLLVFMLGVGSAATLYVVGDAADRLIALQDSTGSWDWDVTNKVGSTGIAYYNIAGVTAEVLVDAYKLTGETKYLDAAKDAGDYLINQYGNPINISKRFNAFNILFLYHLGQVSEDNKYTDEADLIMNNVLHETNNFGSFDVDGTLGLSAEELLNAYEDYRSWASDPNGVVVWDLFPFIESAQIAGEVSFADDMAEIINSYISQVEFDNTKDDYILGLAAAVIGLKRAGLDYNAALAKLLAEQESDGHFETPDPDFGTSYIQSTAYALMALSYALEDSAAGNAAAYLVNNFSYSSPTINGWLESNGKEYSEVTSEASQALFDESFAPVISDVHTDIQYPNLLSTLVKIFATITDENGIDYTTLHYQIGDDEAEDITFDGPFLGGWAGISNGDPKDGVLVKYHIETMDNLGNIQWFPGSTTWLNFTYDGLPPATALTLGLPNSGNYITSATQLTLTCNDGIGGGCLNTYYKIDGGSWNQVTAPYQFYLTELSDDSYTIYYYSIDNAGNIETPEKSTTLILDNTNPQVTLTELNQFYNSVPINLVFTYSDSGSGIADYKVYKKRVGAESDFVDVTIFNPPIAGCNTVGGTTTCQFVDGTAEQDGDFEFKVEVIDKVGHSQDSNVIDTVLDRWGPFAVSLASPVDSPYLNELPLLSWLAAADNNAHLYIQGYGVSGIKEYELVLDGGTPIVLNELSYQTLGLSEGAHTWQVRSNDNAGNNGTWSETRTFTIDTIAPIISNVGVSPNYGNYVDGTITANATVIDSNSINSVTFNLGGQVCTATKVDDTWACDINTTSLGDGEYTLIVTAVDVAENVIVDASLNVIVDNTAPATSIVSPAQDSLFASNFAISVSDLDSGSGTGYCEYRVNSGTWKPRNCNTEVTITVGEEITKDCRNEGEDVCSVEVRATDNLGNGNIETERAFSIDWTNPPQILDSRPSGTIVNSFTELYVETNKPAICKYDTTYKSSYNAMTYTMGPTGLVHSQYVPNLIDKSYNYYVMCKDTAGNEMLYPASISFDVDTRKEFNVTIPETKGDYLRTGWNQFFLPSFVLANTTLTGPSYEVDEVLASIEGSYGILYHFDGTTWKSYDPTRPVNDLTVFNGGGFPYYVYMNAEGERIEIV